MMLPDWVHQHEYSDKIAHIIYGLIFYFISIVCLFAIPDLTWIYIPMISCILTIILSVGIEIYDYKTGNGTPEVLDAAVTMLLPVILSIIFYGFLLIFQ